MKGEKSTYWSNVRAAISTLSSGLKHTSKHFPKALGQRTAIGVEDPGYFDQSDGLQTVLYPHEALPVPDNGRYKLHNEIDDCIVCDKCAKICPVDCIDIEPIRAVEDLGKTSDGTPKRIHAAKFDIDMGKCCFCGLCTTVCPTECLTMTNEFDYSEFDVKEHKFPFATMTPTEILEKKEALEKFNAEKQKKQEITAKADNKTQSKPAKPSFRPKVKPKTTASSQENSDTSLRPYRPKIKMKPVVKSDTEKSEDVTKAKPKFRPKMKPVVKKTDDQNIKASEETETTKPKFKPKPKPVIKNKTVDSESKLSDNTTEEKPKFKPRPRPVMKKKNEEDK